MTDQSRSLDGKVALVTGAGRGIGKAIAITYAEEGANVCCAARTSSEIEGTVREIESFGGRGFAVQTDVTKQEAVEQMFKAASQRFGGIDIVVVNAGGNLEPNRVEDSDTGNWVATIELNLIGAYYCVRSAIPYLRSRGGGKIITVGSGIGHRGRPARSAYACAKAGLSILTRVAAQETWEYNISVNELIPGPVDTRLTSESSASVKDSVFSIYNEWIKRPEDVTPPGPVPGYPAKQRADGAEL